MMTDRTYDRIIIGAGLYGLYAAKLCGGKNEKVLVLERDPEAFGRATYINQARVHMGYHYPRSLTTAMKSAGYFRRFCEDYDFCIERGFQQIYATSSRFSWTDAEQFTGFCQAAGIRCEEQPVSRYFNPEMCDGAFLTEEYTYDARMLRDYFLESIRAYPNVTLLFNARITKIRTMDEEGVFRILLEDSSEFETPFLLNATYASTNQVLNLAEGIDQKRFNIKYELCEIILTEPSDALRGIGLTVMDGPFFSIMPFGKTGYHSLTAVSFTPHVASYDALPKFHCQELAVKELGEKEGRRLCCPEQLGNCGECPYRPESAWPYMDHLARKYMLPRYDYRYVKSLFSMKPILKSSEVDDSRPTAIHINHDRPRMVSVLSGKINTVYDLDEFLQ